MDPERFLNIFNLVMMVLFSVCYFYQYLYMFLYFILAPIDRKKRASKGEYRPTGKRYAVLICARNEEKVIGDLIDCVAAQDYPGVVKTFVMADNCSDRTAEIAGEHGAAVYERHDLSLIGKGYAMELLLENIERDHPGAFDGFFVFDADNILPADYISKMDETIGEGRHVVTGYRNTKNFGDSWFSASSGLWYMRENRFMNHVRSMLGLSSLIMGTGFYFSKEILDELGGWKYHSLTEDTEFSADVIIHGYKIGFCPDAQVYDEQTPSFRQSFRQRLRWLRGYLEVLKLKGGKLIRMLFKGNFSCYDMVMSIAPAFFFALLTATVNIVMYAVIIATGGDVPRLLMSILQMLVGMYSTVFLVGLLACISEWKNIRTTAVKKLLTVLVLPIFFMTYVPIAMTAIFVKPVWKPIDHSVSLKDLEKRPEEERLPAATK